MEIDINICTPISQSSIWGDTAFAESLATQLNFYGHDTQIRKLEEWNNSSDSEITLTITGKYKHKPEPNKFNILWIISHPELRDKEELNSFNLVLIASEQFTQAVKNDVIPPVYFLPQATDPGRFYPRNCEKDIDVLFVGNNYYDNFDRRKIVDDVLKSNSNVALKVVGKNWEKGVPSEMILSDFVDYQDLPSLYSRAKICLNDHHEFMRRYGFVNNRTYDLGYLSQFQISDYVLGMEKLGIVTYSEINELRKKLDYYLQNENERTRNEKIVSKLTENNTFKNCADRINELISKHF